MQGLTTKELTVIYNLTKKWLREMVKSDAEGEKYVRSAHSKVSQELSRRGAFL